MANSIGQELPEGACASRPLMRTQAVEASKGHQETDDNGKQCNTFDEGSKDQSSALDRALGFRLTGNALTGSSADPTDTHACAYSSKSCSKSCTDACAVVSGFGKGLGSGFSGGFGGFGILEEIKHWGFSVLN